MDYVERGRAIIHQFSNGTCPSVTMKFVDNLKLTLLGPSLGGTETLVTQLSTASHFFMDPEERRKAGISDSLVRLLLGIEDADDIIADLEQAFDKAIGLTRFNPIERNYNELLCPSYMT